MNKNLPELIKDIRLVIFDFDGVFTDNKVIIDEQGKESVVCSRSDGLGLSRLKQIGIESLILSAEINKVVRSRARKLKIKCINACQNKFKVLFKEIKKRKLVLEQVAYVGNDINDLECLKAVGLPIAVRDAHSDIIRYAKFRTKLRGGQGAVREICDVIYAVKNGDKRNA